MKPKINFPKNQLFAFGIILAGTISLYLGYLLVQDFRFLTSGQLDRQPNQLIQPSLNFKEHSESDAQIEFMEVGNPPFEVLLDSSDTDSDTPEWAVNDNQSDHSLVVGTDEVEQMDRLIESMSEPKQPTIEAHEDNLLLEAKQLSQDPISQDKEITFYQSGLLFRHSAISESIFLMEQQLKQAQLILQLMEIMGPETQIELAPGQFESFAQFPAGKRVAAKMQADELRSQLEILELTNRVTELNHQLLNSSSEGITGDWQGSQLTNAASPEILLSDIIAVNDNFEAILLIDQIPTLVEIGTVLANGDTVVAITHDELTLSSEAGLEVISIR